MTRVRRDKGHGESGWGNAGVCKNFGHLIGEGGERKLISMKRLCGCACVLIISSFILRAQDKPQVIVQVPDSASGSGNILGVLGSKSAGNSQDGGAEFGKYLQQDCAAVAVSAERAPIDYLITLTPPEKKKGDLRSKSQVQIANRVGKVIGTNFLHTSGNAVKDACALIDADWKAHGKLPDTAAPVAGSVLTPGATAPPESGPAVVQPANTLSTSAGLETSSSTGVAAGGSAVDGGTMGDAAQRAKQHAACLKQARENPNISCK